MSWTKPAILLLAAIASLAVVPAVHASAISLVPASAVSPDRLSIVYDPASGNVTAHAPQGTKLTAFELRSSSMQFTGACGGEFFGPFDVCSAEKVFKLSTGGFDTLDLGAILPAGLSASALADDLITDGASLGGGFRVGDGPILVAVPEPMSAGLLAAGVAGLLVFRRKR